MIARRKFIIGAGSVLAAPFVVRSSSALVGTPRVRKDVMALSPGHPFFSSYADAVRAMHERNPNDPRSWNRQALIHIQFCPHGGLSYFLHWHRYYIKFFEEICGEILGNMDFALPYWNWQSGIGRVPNPFYDVDELNVAFWNDPSGVQSDNWSPDLVTTTGVRALAKGEGLKRQLGGAAFRDRQIRSIQRQTDFSVYSSMLEMHPHNLAHTLVGGTDGHMGDGMSPLDPIFWLHHSNVDRLTAEWQAAGNSMPPDNQIWEGQFFTGQGKGTAVVSGDAVDIGALGYAYETPSGLITGPTAPVERSLFEASSPRIEVLGATRKTMQAMANNTTSVSVDTSNLPQALLSPHSFRLPFA